MPAEKTIPLSVVIISLNEEKRIGDCLASVRELSTDLIVVDSHSRDGTVEIAESLGARVLRRTWTGYSEQKNFGNAHARHDWILSLDADERVTPELARNIREELARGAACDAYSIRFENYFGARCIRFGAWNPEWHVRLFNRSRLAWNTADVHEGLCHEGEVRVGRLRGCIRHLTVDSREQLAEKTERYSSLFATNTRRKGRKPGWSKIWLNPAWRLTRDYVLKLGLLDGKPGAWIAWEAARYTHLKYWKALPEPRSARPHWLGWSTATALLLLLVLRLPTSIETIPHNERPVINHSAIEATHATAGALAVDDDDDNYDVFDVLPNDDDVLV